MHCAEFHFAKRTIHTHNRAEQICSQDTDNFI